MDQFPMPWTNPSQPGMMPGSLPPLGYGNPVTGPNSQTVMPGGSQQFPRRPLTAFIRPPQPAQALPASRGNFYTPPGWTPPQAIPAPPAQAQPTQSNPAGQMPQKPVQPSGTPAGMARVPVQQVAGQPDEVVGTSTGTRLIGTNNAQLDFDVDPMSGANIPNPAGLTQGEFDAALTPTMEYAVNDMMTTLPGPIGDQFRVLEQRRAALMSPQATPNLRPSDRQKQVQALDQQWSALRYSALTDRRAVMGVRARQARDAEEQAWMQQQAAAKQNDMAVKEAQRQQQEQWKMAWDRAVANPAGKYRNRTQAEITAEAQQYMAEMQGGLIPQQPGPADPRHPPVSVSMNDPLDYGRRADGTWYGVDENGREFPADVVNGVVVAAPQSEAEADALPPGSKMVVWNDGVPKIENGPKAPTQKALPEKDASDVELQQEAEAMAERRRRAYDRWQGMMEKWQEQADAWEEKKKVAIEPDWEKTHPKPLPPRKPVEVSDLEEWYKTTQDGLAGVPLDYGAVSYMDQDKATQRYWAKMGMSPVEVPFRRAVESLRKYPRLVVDNRQAIQIGNTVVPTEQTEWRGKKAQIPVPETADQAWVVIQNAVPFRDPKSRSPGVLDLDGVRGMVGEKAPVAVARFVKETFPAIPRPQQEVLAQRIWGAM